VRLRGMEKVIKAGNADASETLAPGRKKGQFIRGGEREKTNNILEQRKRGKEESVLHKIRRTKQDEEYTIYMIFWKKGGIVLKWPGESMWG